MPIHYSDDDDLENPEDAIPIELDQITSYNIMNPVSNVVPAELIQEVTEGVLDAQDTHWGQTPGLGDIPVIDLDNSEN